MPNFAMTALDGRVTDWQQNCNALSMYNSISSHYWEKIYHVFGKKTWKGDDFVEIFLFFYVQCFQVTHFWDAGQNLSVAGGGEYQDIASHSKLSSSNMNRQSENRNDEFLH